MKSVRFTRCLSTVVAGGAIAAALVAASAGGPALAATTHSASSATANHLQGSLPDGASWIADMPAHWNGVLVLYSHGFGSLDAADAPDPTTRSDLLGLGYGLVGSSYSGPSLWALASAEKDQFAALAALQQRVGPARYTLAFGTSMGGLVSAQEAQDSHGRLAGALTTCGLVGGGVNLTNYQLDGEYAIDQLLHSGPHVQLVNYANTSQVNAAINQLTDAVHTAQGTPAGRARIALAAALFNTPDWMSGSAPPSGFAQQEAQEASWLPQQLSFVMQARQATESAVGGNAAWNVGVDYASLLDRSAQRAQVAALYGAAGISLGNDEHTLTANAGIRPSGSALQAMSRTSTVTGRLDVPELDLHTISDQLSPVAYENLYAQQVAFAGSGALLRQAYVAAVGHCNFTSSELVAGLQTVERRAVAQQWPATDSRSLNRSAAATGFGPSAFVDFTPPPFVNARQFGR